MFSGVTQCIRIQQFNIIVDKVQSLGIDLRHGGRITCYGISKHNMPDPRPLEVGDCPIASGGGNIIWDKNKVEMSLRMRKTTMPVSDQVRHKLVCTVTEAG